MVRHLRTLGTLALYDEEGAAQEDAEPLLSHSKSLALLAYVALAPGREASRGHLARLLWPEAGRTQARRSLRQALYYLSQRAGGELLRAEDDAVSVVEETLEVDAWAFERALREDRLQDAVALYDGEFLGGFGGRVGREFESWIETQNERIWSGLKAAYHELVNRSIERGDLERAVRFGRAYVDLNPFDEAAQSTLVGALLARGDRVAAYQQYESFRTLLDEELDEEPDPGLTDRIEELQAEIFSSRDVGDLTAVLRSGARSAAASDRAPREAPAEESPGLLASGPFRWALTGALAATLVFALIAAVQWLPAGEPAGAPGWEGADGTLRIVHGRDGRRTSEVRIRNGVGSLAPIDVTPRTVISPDGELLGQGVATDSGVDIAVRRTATGEVLARAAERADETPLTWAPDGSRLLFDRSERLEDDRVYRRWLHVLRVAEDTTTRLGGRRQHNEDAWAAWSPRGGRIAHVGAGAEGDKEVWITRVDGTGTYNLSSHPATDVTPTWSPDARRVVFASDRAGTLDLYVVDARGGEPERLTFGPADEFGPAWLDRNRLAYRAVRADGEGEIWLLDLGSRNTRLVLDGIEGLRQGRAHDALSHDGWVDTVLVRGGDVELAVGEQHRFGARLATASGRDVSPDGLPVRWESLAPRVLEVDSAGRATARRIGTARLAVSLGGWRSDTVRVRVGTLRTNEEIPLLLREDWSTGLDEGRWQPFGTPLPEFVEDTDDSVEGIPGRSLDPNGDANYFSGVFLREPLSVRDGLTLEIEARVPLTGQLYQTLRAGLHTRAEAEEYEWQRMGRGLAALHVGGDRPSHGVIVDGELEDLPMPDEPGREHLYAVQVEPTGHVSYVLDGRRVWRSARPAIGDLTQEVYLRIAGQSLHAEIQVDEVRLWRGVRYVVGDPPEREFRIAPRRTRGSDEPSGR